MVTNPNFFSTSNDSDPLNQIKDAVDFPHSGLIKSLNGAMSDRAVISGCDITVTDSGGGTNNFLTVTAGIGIIEGKRCGITGNAQTMGFLPTDSPTAGTMLVNSFHLVVAPKPSSSGSTQIVLRVSSNTTNTIPDIVAGDTIIAVVKYLGTAAEPEIQYLTADKKTSSLSLAFDNSNVYTEIMKVGGDANRTTFQNTILNSDIRFILADNTADEKFEIMTDDDADGQLTPVSEVFSVDGTGVTKVKSLSLGTAGELTITESSDDITIKNTVSNKDIIFNIKEGTTDTELMRLDGSASRVGIGTATPAATVDIAGDLRVTNNIFQQHKDMTNNLAVGWHTVAHIKGRSGGSASGTASSAQRGIAQIIIKEESSGKHALYEFKVNHLFGTGNAIQLENSAFFAAKIIQQVRMKENSTYDGAVFQIYVSDATNNLQVFITDNFADHGWTVNDAVADADNSGHDSLGLGYNNAYSTFSATRTYNLDTLDVVDGGTIMGGNAFVQGNLQINTGKTFRSRRLPTISLTASTTLVEGTHAGTYIFVTGSSIVITIPDNQGAGVHFTIINNDGNGFTLRTGAGSSAGDNMNGAQTDITVAARNGVTCISTGTDYVVLGV